MKQMSEFITKLEGYSDLEVSIIRATKINKVLKGILKLEEIPKEAEFKFRERSTELLTKWNKILESDTPAPASAQTNGALKEQVNGASAKAEDGSKAAGFGLDGADDTPAPEVDVEDADAKDEEKESEEEEKAQEEEKVQEEEKPQEEEKAADDKTEVCGSPTRWLHGGSDLTNKQVAVAEATPVEATA